MLINAWRLITVIFWISITSQKEMIMDQILADNRGVEYSLRNKTNQMEKSML